MRGINTWEEVLGFVSEFRNKGCFINNFYPNESEMSVWIENGEFFVGAVDGTSCFFVRKTEIAAFLYFFVADICDLKQTLPKIQNLLSGEVLVYDYICKNDEERNRIKEVSALCEFELHTSLRRMSFVSNGVSFENESEVAFAGYEDLDCLLGIFKSAFDPISERIPTRHQLKSYVEHRSVLICKKQNQIAGFAVIAIHKKMMYLKHLFTSPDFRRQGIAEKLLKKAFFLSEGCVRFMLWVIDTNIPAINLYKKFGYDFEALSNYTFISKQQ